MLELLKVIRTAFILFYVRSWQGKVFKIIKNDHFLVFCPFESFSPDFWVIKGVTYVRTAQNKKSVTFSCVPNCFCLFYE